MQVLTVTGLFAGQHNNKLQMSSIIYLKFLIGVFNPTLSIYPIEGDQKDVSWLEGTTLKTPQNLLLCNNWLSSYL